MRSPDTYHIYQLNAGWLLLPAGGNIMTATVFTLAPLSSRPAGFRLDQPLFRGGTSTAWLARPLQSQRRTLLQCPRNKPAQPRACTAWMRRASLPLLIEHRHLAQGVQIGQHAGWPYVAVDCQDRVSLAERCSGQAPSLIEAARWMRQALLGVDVVHRAGVLFGDLTLHHVLLMPGGLVQVAALAAVPGTPELSGVPPSVQRDMAACARMLRDLVTASMQSLPARDLHTHDDTCASEEGPGLLDIADRMEQLDLSALGAREALTRWMASSSAYAARQAAPDSASWATLRPGSGAGVAACWRTNSSTTQSTNARTRALR